MYFANLAQSLRCQKHLEIKWTYISLCYAFRAQYKNVTFLQVGSKITQPEKKVDGPIAADATGVEAICPPYLGPVYEWQRSSLLLFSLSCLVKQLAQDHIRTHMHIFSSHLWRTCYLVHNPLTWKLTCLYANPYFLLDSRHIIFSRSWIPVHPKEFF